MSVLKAPYNFVPLSKRVVTPYWAPFVSHDVPFEDAQSGTLKVSIKAETEIFVNDGLGKDALKEYFNENGEQIKPFEFNNIDGKYFIPGSSIKGMVRNVLEIMSFGRMENKVNDHRFALRDLSGAMKDIYLKNFKPADNNKGVKGTRCGWLSKNENGTYSLDDCGIPGRISHKVLDDYFQTNFCDFYGERGGFSASNDSHKSAQKKYELFMDNERNHRFSLSPKQDTTGRKKFYIKTDGEIEGTLVFTGQPGVRKKQGNRMTGHFLEFIFFKKIKTIEKVDEKVIQNFLFAYFEDDKKKWSKDWAHWRNELNEGRKIPVFFNADDYGTPKHFGLSYLYKLPYKYSVKESIDNHQKETDVDLSETIFGFIDNEKGALKGRVQFGHAFAQVAEKCSKPRLEVLAGPKASYYPTYIRQSFENGVVKNYKTFMDKSAVISGWKRYPVYKETVSTNPPPVIKGKVNKKVATSFVPLKAGAVFNFEIKYHNLKEIELGALLSALTFHKTNNTFHSIGMAKPLGYGKIKLEIDDISNFDTYLKAFESYMEAELGKFEERWLHSEQITELLTMASEQDYPNDPKPYMDLKDFVKARNKDKYNKNDNYEGLDLYSKLKKNEVKANSFCTPEDIRNMQVKMQEEEKGLKKLRPVKDILNEMEEENKNTVQLLFEKKKQERIEELKQLIHLKQEELRLEKEAQEKEQIAKRREEKRKEALAAGLDVSKVKAKGKKPMKDLDKELKTHYRKEYATNDKSLEADYPEGFVKKEEHGQVIEKIKEIFEACNAKEKKKWLAPFEGNHEFKKVTIWIGEDEARKIYQTLNA